MSIDDTPTDVHPQPPEGGVNVDIRLEKWGARNVLVSTPGGVRRRLDIGGVTADSVVWVRAAAELGVPLETLRSTVHAFLNPPRPERAARGDGVIYSRPRGVKREDAETFPATLDGFRGALEVPGVAWMEWPGSVDALAILDVDYHGDTPPPAWDALRLAIMERVRPAALWRSKGGGAHALLEALEGFTAEELAAAVAVDLAGPGGLSGASFEVLSRTAAPTGDVEWGAQTIGSLLPEWRAAHREEPSTDEVEGFRAEKGWTGGDAEHDQCPVDPRRPSSTPGKRPVYFTAAGVGCLSCRARGLRSFTPWAAIIGGRAVENRVAECARSLACWSHARLVIAEEVDGRVPAPSLRAAYYALCKLIHGADDTRISRLSRSPFGDFVRGMGCWLDPRGYSPVDPDPAYFRAMPSNTYVTADGEVRVDATSVSRCKNPGDVPGFPPVIPVHGAQVWGVFLDYPDDPRAVRVSVDGGRHPARYVPAGERMRLADAVDLLRERFPGLNLPYLQLLIVARGFAESGVGRVPRIVTTGPTGSAKSTTVSLAAAMMGDRAMVVPHDRKTFREAFDRAVAGSPGFVVCDEFAKPNPGKRRRPEEGSPFAIFLPLESRDYTARLLYIGPVATRFLSAVVLTGTQLPEGMDVDRQLARRFIRVALHESTPEKWEESCGFHDVAFVRDHLPEACDAVVSDIVDRFFVGDERPGSFDAAAEVLGFRLLADELEERDESGDLYSSVGRVRRLFELVTTGEGVTDPPARYKARGRVTFPLFGETEVALVWRELCDGMDDTSTRLRSERLSELDLRRVLGVTTHPGHPVWCEIKGDYQTVCIRFGVGPTRFPLAVNGELLKTEEE
jgi:hypothetical protein